MLSGRHAPAARHRNAGAFRFCLGRSPQISCNREFRHAAAPQARQIHREHLRMALASFKSFALNPFTVVLLTPARIPQTDVKILWPVSVPVHTESHLCASPPVASCNRDPHVTAARGHHGGREIL